MCAHGALQAQANPEVKRILNNHFDLSEASAAPAEEGAARARASARARVPREGGAEAEAEAAAVVAADATEAATSAAVVEATLNNSKFKNVWNNRPDWVKKNITKDGIEYGNLDAHYLLGMVGLTTSFNDHKKTTLEMVHQKFDEAIELARHLLL